MLHMVVLKFVDRGNNEIQYYTQARKENARVENGYLIIEARKEKFADANYTSARLVTKNKGDWKYGRMVIRAKIPTGKGLWPAGWVLPTHKVYGEWPKSGEIDILEAVGYAPDSAFGSVHTGRYNGMIGTQKTASLIVPNLSTKFHDYEIVWTQKKLIFISITNYTTHLKTSTPILMLGHLIKPFISF